MWGAEVTALFKFLQQITGQYELCFREDGRKSQSAENAVLGVIRGIGYEGQTCGHGFRHQFGAVLNEEALEQQRRNRDAAGTRKRQYAPVATMRISGYPGK